MFEYAKVAKKKKKKQDKRTNNDLQNITHKTKDWATQTPLKTGMKSGAYTWGIRPVCIYIISEYEFEIHITVILI